MLKVRLATTADASPVVKLVRDGFDREKLELMVYGCGGMAAYIRQQLSVPRELSDTVYLVGELRGAVAGCVELRRLQDALFLNYICISPGQRRKGLGNELLRQALLIAKRKAHAKISLDVFCDNRIAASWYKRLGFKTDYHAAWWNIALPHTHNGPHGTISGYGQANACQRVFGFSQFSLETKKNIYSIGRLGDAWFRVTQRELLADKDALACLPVLDAKRKLLGIFPEDPKVRIPHTADLFCRSARMTMKLDTLLRNLTD